MTIEDNKRKINMQNRANLDHLSDSNNSNDVFMPLTSTPKKHLILVNSLLAFINKVRLESTDRKTRIDCERRLRAAGVMGKERNNG